MKTILALCGLSIGLTISPLAASAADWGYGNEGIKDYQGGEAVTVPAPVPIPDYAPSWYFRFDAGLGVINDPGLSGHYEDVPDHPDGDFARYDIPSSWFSSDFDTFLTLGGGFGYYFGNGFRLDATLEKRSKDDYGITGSDDWVSNGFDCLGCYTVIDADVNGVGDHRTGITVNESGKVDGTLWMANLYYDFHTRRGLTPYVGAGLGFVWNEISRSSSTTYTRCDTDNVDDSVCDPGGAGHVPHPDHPTTIESSDKANKVSLAAAAMAGLSYDISDMTAIDIGYRYLFMQGASATLDVNGVGTRVKIDDQHVHQVRAGLRFNVN